MKELLKRFVREEEGQDLIEYALVAAIITAATIGIIVSISGKVGGLWQNVESAVDQGAAS